MAETNPSPRQPPEESQAQKHVSKGWSEYEPLLDTAEKMSAMTATAYWRGRFRDTQKEHRDAVQATVKTLRSIIESIAVDDTSDTMEKALRDQAKVLTDARERFAAWDTLTCQPMRAVESQATTIRERVMRTARDVEASQPLLSAGLVSEVSTLMRQWPTIKWDGEAGVMTVTYPDAGAAKAA